MPTHSILTYNEFAHRYRAEIYEQMERNHPLSVSRLRGALATVSWAWLGVLLPLWVFGSWDLVALWAGMWGGVQVVKVSMYWWKTKPSTPFDHAAPTHNPARVLPVPPSYYHDYLRSLPPERLVEGWLSASREGFREQLGLVLAKDLPTWESVPKRLQEVLHHPKAPLDLKKAIKGVLIHHVVWIIDAPSVEPEQEQEKSTAGSSPRPHSTWMI